MSDDEAREEERAAAREYTERNKRMAGTNGRDMEVIAADGDSEDPVLLQSTSSVLLERQSEYHARRLKRTLSPDRADAFSVIII